MVPTATRTSTSTSVPRLPGTSPSSTASAGEGASIQVWSDTELTAFDAPQDARRRQGSCCKGHLGGVRAAALTADGCCSPATGRPDRATVGHADRPAAGHAGRPLPPVGGVALSASGEVVASGKAKLTWAHWVSPTAPVVTVRKACLN